MDQYLSYNATIPGPEDPTYQPPLDTDEHPQKKRKRRTTKRDPNATKECLEVDRDESGRPVVPIQLSASLQVNCLGEIVPDKAYYATRYLFPAGFRSARLYTSFKSPGTRVWYTSEIVRGGRGPVFRVTAEDAPGEPIESNSATGAWTDVLRRVDASRPGTRRKFTAVSGPEQFGYVNPTVARLLQDLPGVERCAGFQRGNFAVVGRLGEKKIPRRARRVSHGDEEEEELAAGTVQPGYDPYATASSSDEAEKKEEEEEKGDKSKRSPYESWRDEEEEEDELWEVDA